VRHPVLTLRSNLPSSSHHNFGVSAENVIHAPFLL